MVNILYENYCKVNEFPNFVQISPEILPNRPFLCENLYLYYLFLFQLCSEISIRIENKTTPIKGNVTNPNSTKVGLSQLTVEAIAGHGISSE